MLFAIVMGTFCGTALAFYASKWLLDSVAERFAQHAEQRKTIKAAGVIFGAIALAPAIFLVVLGGGKQGMHYSSMIANAIGLGDIGATVILALGVIAAITIVATVNTAMGTLLGVMFARSLYRGRS